MIDFPWMLQKFFRQNRLTTKYQFYIIAFALFCDLKDKCSIKFLLTPGSGYFVPYIITTISSICEKIPVSTKSGK